MMWCAKNPRKRGFLAHKKLPLIRERGVSMSIRVYSDASQETKNEAHRANMPGLFTCAPLENILRYKAVHSLPSGTLQPGYENLMRIPPSSASFKTSRIVISRGIFFTEWWFS